MTLTFTFSRVRGCFLGLLLTALLVLAPVNAVAGNYRFQHIDSKRGLPHQQVEALAIDADGNLWMGTRGGLARYDGYAVRTYYHDASNPASLQHNLVHALHLDRQGRLWACTETGVCRYRPETDDFRCYAQPQGLFWSVTEDQDGRLFFGGRALYRLDEQQDTLLPLPLLTDAFVNALAAAPTGELYVATNSQLLRYDRALSRITALPPELYADFMTSRNVIVPLHFDHRGQLWVGRNGRGVMSVDLQTGQRRIFQPAELSNGIVRCITEDASHRIWLGTEGGITVLHPDGRREFLRHRFQDANSLSDNAIYAILPDSAQNLWVGSYFGGVDYLLSSHEQFRFYEPGTAEGELPARVPRMMTETSPGTYWLTTEDAGIFIYDAATGRFTPFNGIPGMGTNIHSILHDSLRHEMWIGTRFEGIYCYDLQRHTARHYLYSHGLSSEGCFWLAQQRTGQLWVATMQGLRRYDREADTFLPVGHDVLDSCFIYTLHIDAQDNVWAGTNTRGIYCIDARTRSIKNYAHEDGTGLLDNYIICLHTDRQGHLWVGTNSCGLQCMDLQTGRFTASQELLLARCTVCSFLEDDDAGLWVATSQGLFRRDLQTGAIVRFSSESSGLPSNQFNYASSLRARNGRLLFGTINGLISFLPRQLRQEQGPFVVHLKGLATAGEADDPATLPRLDAASRLVLTHNQATHFTIEYGIIRPAGTATVVYQVQLEGVDRAWRNVGTERRFSAFKLPAGTYRLHLRAASAGAPDEVWAQSPVRTLEIVVRPPLWRSPWAMALWALLLAALAYGAWRFSQLRLREKNDIRMAHLEREHLRQLDKAKSNFFATAAHELKTPLTLITAPLRSITRGQLDATGRQHLDMAIQNAAKMQELIGELVTFNKLESGGFPFYLQRGNPLLFIQNMMSAFSDACQQSQLTLTVRTEDNGEVVCFSPSYLERILNNLMSNAIKFTPKGGSIAVEASIDSRQDSPHTFLRCSVRDTGIGILPEELDKIFDRFYQTRRGYYADSSGWGIGLSLVQRLVDIHQGRVDVQSTVGQGTTFTIWLCVSEAAFGETAANIADLTLSGKAEADPSQTQATPPSWTATEAEAAPAQAQTPEAEAPLLLLVDDNTDLLHFLCQTFQPQYQVITATNGREALQLASTQDVQMVISDVMMPEMDGNELCQRLKADMQTSHIPVILLTAKSEQEDVRQGYQAGAEAYVPKPFDPQTLLLQVGNILRLIRQRRQQRAENTAEAIQDDTLSELDRDFMQRMSLLVEQHLADSDFSIADITAALGVSRSLLHLKMKNIVGISMGDYIRQQRLAAACRLLLQGHNVSETAYATGFSDPNYFSKTFKKHLGVSPKDYHG